MSVSILFPLPFQRGGTSKTCSRRRRPGTRVVALAERALFERGVPDHWRRRSRSTGEAPSRGFAAYDALRVVAMRIDPCFASLDPDPHGAGCTAQIRLVFQEVRWEPSSSDAGAPVAFDSALHVFYDLTRGEFLALAQALVDIRVANANGEAAGPLAPHPIMARQGLGGSMAKGVEQLILLYAGEKNLDSAWRSSAPSTTSSPRAPGRCRRPTWEPSRPWRPPVQFRHSAMWGRPLDRVRGWSAVWPGGRRGPAHVQRRVRPDVGDRGRLHPLDDGTAESLSPSARETAFDALVRVENPRDNSPNTMSTAVGATWRRPPRSSVAMPLFSLDDTMGFPLAFQPDGTRRHAGRHGGDVRHAVRAQHSRVQLLRESAGHQPARGQRDRGSGRVPERPSGSSAASGEPTSEPRAR